MYLVSYLCVDISSFRGVTSDSRDSRQLTVTMISLTATMDSSTWCTSISKCTSSYRKERLSVDDEEGEIIMRCCALCFVNPTERKFSLEFKLCYFANGKFAKFLFR